MLNYPFPKAPVYYSNYKFEMNLSLMNKVLFQTVFIGWKTDKVLNTICFGIMLPFTCLFTLFIAYKTFRVSYMPHVRKLETTLVCYAFIEICGMNIFSTTFSLYYWTWGAVNDEDDYGTSRFTCLFYLYFFNYLPAFCANLSNCTIAMLILLYYRKWKPEMCGMKLTNFNLRTFYVVLTNGALCDVLFIFCISWITIAKTPEMKNYQHKCFVLLNPVFQRFKLINWIKGMEWETQIFSHSLPYFFTISYLMFALYKILEYHMTRRKGLGIQLGEKQRYGGCVVTLGFTIIFLICDTFFNLFCDVYEISLHYSTGPTNAEFFFFLKNCKTVMRTISYMLSPFQLLALCSLNPHFQSTMVRYLNGTEKIEVLVQKTIGGETRKKVLYEDLPDPSQMTWLAWLYFKWLRSYYAVWLFRKFLDFVDEYRANRRHSKRQKKEDKQIAKDKKENARKRQIIVPTKRESRIQVDCDGNLETVNLAPDRRLRIRETTV